MTRNPKQRILTTMALSLVGAALAAGNANAERPDEGAGTIPYLSHGIGVDQSRFSGAASTVTQIAHPNDRAGLLGVGAVGASTSVETAGPGTFPRGIAQGATTPLRPDDRPGPRGPGVFSAPPILSTASADDFAWGDASIGAGAMLAAVLLGAGIAASFRHRGRAVMP